MNRHVHPSTEIPEGVINAKHHDALGNDSFGGWTTENLMFWFIRLIFITNPSNLIGAIRMNDDIFHHSLVSQMTTPNQ